MQQQSSDVGWREAEITSQMEMEERRCGKAPIALVV